MAITRNQKIILSQVVLASMLFIALPTHSVEIINVELNTTQTTSTIDDDIQITSTGQLSVPANEGIFVDDDNRTITIDPNNDNGFDAIETVGVAEEAIQVDNAKNTIINIGANSGITTDNAAFSGLFLNSANNTTVNNSGTIQGGAGIDINNSPGTIINNNSTGTIQGGASPSIDIASSTTINNSGNIISSAGIAINATNNFTIVNSASGTIKTDTAGSQAILIASPTTGSITNSGTIQTDVAGVVAIEVDAALTGTITNNSGALIQATTAPAIRFDADFTTLNNSGTIQTTGAGPAIQVATDTTGTINNLSGGILTSTGAGIGLDLRGNVAAVNNTGTIDGITVQTNPVASTITNNSGGVINAGFSNTSAFTGDLINNGAIENTAFALNIDGAFNGDITNNGTITSTNIGLELNGGNDITGTFTNNGTITADAAAIEIAGANAITGGLINNGNIVRTTPGNAILMSAATKLTKFTQNAGTVDGDVRLSGGGGNAFDLNGGNIIGDVYSDAATGGSTLNLVGGTITGDLNLQDAGDVVNFTSPTITGTIAGTVGNTFNIIGNFTHAGAFTNATNIVVQNGGSYNVNGPVTGNNDIDVQAGGTLILNNTIMGTANPITNAGTIIVNADNTFNANLDNNNTLTIDDDATLTVNQLLNNDPAAVLNILATDATEFGSVVAQVAGSTLTGSTINIQLTGEGLLLNGDVLTILTSPGAITDGSTVSDASATLNFIKALNGNNIDITIERIPFQAIAQSVNGQALGMSLDTIGNGIAQNADLGLAVAQIDTLPTNAEVSQALESLVPQVDGGLLQVSHDFTNRVYDTIGRRMDETRSIPGLVSSISSGDDYWYGMGTWAKVYASRITQNNRKGFDGYNASLSGLSIGNDVYVDPALTLGGALSYSTADVDTKSFTQNELDIRSFQLTVYGQYEAAGPWYWEGYASAALNRYKTKRNVVIGNLARTATANFNAWQYAVKGEGGYIFSWGKYQITPIAAMKFSYLDLDKYTEHGAGGLSLAVDQVDTTELVTTAGIRFSSVNEYVEATYIPELRLMAHYDWFGDKQETFANFVASPVSFRTLGFRPDQLTYNIGTGLTARTSDDMSLVINYDLEFKDQFLSHNFFLKFKYVW